jgi:hypothetical protein
MTADLEVAELLSDPHDPILEIQMKPEGGHDYRSPGSLLKPRVVDAVHSRTDIDSTPKVCRGIRLDDLLPPVVESIAADQGTVSAIRQIHLVTFLD